ncbi:putative MFS transporter [Xylariales sp. PMI_506]|nr:putative MFS transporter [Xylariales sp. PMI_506]
MRTVAAAAAAAVETAGFQSKPVLQDSSTAANVSYYANLHEFDHNEAAGRPSRNSESRSPAAPAVASIPPPEATANAPLSSAGAITLLMAPLCIAVLLSALDLTVITPVIPSIAGSFAGGGGNDFVWIGAAFILASTASTPIWGAISDIWGRRPVLLLALALFLAGSAVCGAAPRMSALIAGRAVQGLGSAGAGALVNIIICDSFSLRDRGLYLALTSAVWAVGSAVGPIIGGVFATRLSWRWCFWINLPLGAVVMVVIFFFLRLPTPKTPVMAGLKAIDWPGSLLIVGSAIMVLLGLEFGDVIFPWSSATIVCLLVFGVVVIVIFITNEWKFAANPVIPLRLFSQRSSAAAYVVYACNFYVLIGLSYYVPLYSQSVLGSNALESGVHLLPLIVSSSLSAACTGALIQKTGKYLFLMYTSQVVLVLGVGLMLAISFGESPTKLIIFEIITGIGCGMNIEPPLLAAQAATTVLDTAAVVTTMSFIRSIFTAVAIVVGGVILQDRMDALNGNLVRELGAQIAENFTGTLAATNVNLIDSLTTAQQVVVRETYFHSLRSVWLMLTVATGVGLVASLAVRAHHLKVVAEPVVLGVDRAKPRLEEPDNPRRGSDIELGGGIL